jgi:hypothetical protein
MSPPLSAGTSWRDRVGSGAAAPWTRRFLEENRRFLEENKSARVYSDRQATKTVAERLRPVCILTSGEALPGLSVVKTDRAI